MHHAAERTSAEISIGVCSDRSFSKCLFATAPDAWQRNGREQSHRTDEEAKADRSGCKNRPVAIRNLHGAPEVLFQQRTEDQSKQQGRRLTIELAKDIPNDSERRHDQDFATTPNPSLACPKMTAA